MNLFDVLFMAKTGTVKPGASMFDILFAQKLRGAAEKIVTIIGNPLSFITKKSQTAISTKISMEPIQEGSGDPSPENIRPISGRTQVTLNGCGKNLWFDGDKSFTRYKIIEFNPPLEPGIYTFSAIAVSSDTDIDTCAVAFRDSSNVKVGGEMLSRNTRSSFTTVTTDYTYTIWLYASATNSLSAGDTASFTDIQLELGSTATAYEPYQQSNEITITFPALGHNQWDEEWERGGYNGNTGQKTSSEVRIRNKNMIEAIPSTSYYFLKPTTAYIYEYDANKSFLRRYSVNGLFTTSDDCYYLNFNVGTSDNPVTEYDNNISINYPSTFTTYEPYTNTVYGGTLDVEKGELTVDKLAQTFTSAGLQGNYGEDNAPLYYVNSSTAIKPCSKRTDNVYFVSNYFVRNSTSSVALMKDGEMRTTRTLDTPSDSKIYFRWDEAASLTDINTAFASNPLVVVGELVTPTTIQLTPQQVNLLRGVNNVWTDGDSISLTYTDDAKNITDVATDLNYISTDMAPNESTISTAAYQVGDYLILNNNFYKVTAPISIGDTIAVGTNVTRTTIGAELSLLHS